MKWFGKKDKKEDDEVPSLPELPKLPELPRIKGVDSFEPQSIPQLPSYPNSLLGGKFSQNVIKDAITGEKEDEETNEANDSMESEMMHKSLTKNFPTERAVVPYKKMQTR